MVLSLVILVCSSALFFFYVQASCEKALRREFSRPYFQTIIDAIQLEYPRLRDASEGGLNYKDTRLALACDFMALGYLLKNSDRASRPLSRGEKMLFVYFRFLLFTLPVRHALNFKEKTAVIKLAAILQHFANLLGEKLSANSMGEALPDLGS